MEEKMKIFNRNTDDFDVLIKEGLTLVDFYAEWCGPCKMMGPVLESLDDVNVLKVNVDDNEELSTEYRIMSIPTLMFFKDGEKKEEIVGFHSKEQLEEILKKLR
jgi:thioredoxin 1